MQQQQQQQQQQQTFESPRTGMATFFVPRKFSKPAVATIEVAVTALLYFDSGCGEKITISATDPMASIYIRSDVIQMACDIRFPNTFPTEKEGCSPFDRKFESWLVKYESIEKKKNKLKRRIEDIIVTSHASSSSSPRRHAAFFAQKQW